MTLPGDHHHVALLRQREGLANRHRSIRNYNIPLPLTPHLFRPILDLPDDPIRVFRARIVGGDHREVGQAHSGFPHQRPLPAVPIPPTADDYNQAPRTAFPSPVEDPLEGAGGGGGMGPDPGSPPP